MSLLGQLPKQRAMSSYSLRLLFIFSVVFLLSPAVVFGFKGISLGNPVLDVTPIRLSSKEVILCDRLQVSGHSRLKLGSYASAFRVTLSPSVVIPERLHNRIQVCFHWNASLGLCRCEKDEWRTLQKGLWNSVMSPYGNKYIDVKFIGEVSGPATVSVEEEYQGWRLLFLALGFAFLLLAPSVSSWAPFYYSSSMAIGIFLVIIILLFQGMKLLPTGRKNLFYLTVYGSVLGAGSFLVHYFSILVNSILVNFGLSEEMHNPVAIFTLLGIMISGAALGYWIVRKFVIKKDGSVDVAVAQFVKWVMRILAATFIFLSTLDTLLAMGALASCCAICSMFPSARQRGHKNQLESSGDSYWSYKSKQGTAKRAEFLSRSLTKNDKGRLWSSPKTPKSSPAFSAWSNSPVKGLVQSPRASGAGTVDQSNYYSIFHKTKNRKKFTKQEWEDFTRESTCRAVADLAASPEFTDWIIGHADRIKLLPVDSSDESVGSKSSTTDDGDDQALSCRKFGLSIW